MKPHRNLILLALLLYVLAGCDKDQKTEPPVAEDSFVRAVDISFLPQIRASGISTYNREGHTEDMLTSLKNAGVNCVRLRLWNNPSDGHSGLEEVAALSEEIRQLGMKVWLTVHYSDTWADPGNQLKPALWQNISFNALKDSVYAFTQQAVTHIQPDIIQIGNEINNGFLWPDGSAGNMTGFRSLLESGIKAVRKSDTTIRIMLHYAGHTDAPSFFNQMQQLDYDQVGISYYPIWHGRDINALQESLHELSSQTGKEVLIAETSYPFTFGWNDWTNNIIGSSDQILDEFPASEQGQLDFLLRIRSAVDSVSTGKGFCYWGAEWISFKGSQSTQGSSWENQALWDFNNKALPALEAFETALYD